MINVIVSKSLLLSVKNLCTFENVDNMSDHVPLSMLLDFSIDNLTKCKGRKFKSRPKWHSATSTRIEKYKNKLDSLLMLIRLPFTVKMYYVPLMILNQYMMVLYNIMHF